MCVAILLQFFEAFSSATRVTTSQLLVHVVTRAAVAKADRRELHMCAFVIVIICMFIRFFLYFVGVDTRASSSASMAIDVSPGGSGPSDNQRQTLFDLTDQCVAAQSRLVDVLRDLENATMRVALERSRYDALREFSLLFCLTIPPPAKLASLMQFFQIMQLCCINFRNNTILMQFLK